MWRRIGRGLRRVALGLLALVVAAVAVLLIVLHTDWGREQVRQRVVAALRTSFPGGASIGRIEGSVLGDLELRDVELCDASGRPAITAKRVRLNLGYLALLRGELELETLDVDGATVLVELRRGHPANLATAYRSSGPLTWDIGLRRLRIRDLDVTIDRDGALEHLDHLAIDAEADLAATGAIGARIAVTGVARERATSTIAIAAQGWSDATGVVVPSGQLAFGQAAIEVEALTYRFGAGVRGAVAVRALERELVGLTPELGLPVSALDARLAVDLRFVPGATGVAMLAGDGVIAGRVVVAGVALDRVRGAVMVTGGVARVDASAEGPGGTAAVAGGRVLLTGDLLELRDGHLVATIPSIASASRGQIPADGALRVELSATARIAAEPTVEVHGTVHGRGVTYADVRVADVTVDVDAAGPPGALTGEARLTAHQLGKADLILPELAATVRSRTPEEFEVALDARDRTRAARAVIAAQVSLRPARLPHALATIALGDYRLDLAHARVGGRGGLITVEDDRTIVRGVRMRGAGATLAVDAIAGRGRRAGQLEGQLELIDLDLGGLRDLPGVPHRLAGALVVRADLERRGRDVEGTVHASATGLVLAAGARPVDVAVGAEARPRRLTLALSASGPELGLIAAAVDVTPPRHLDDLVAWTHLERAAIDRLELRARRLDLARLVQLTGRAPSVEGMVDGALQLDQTHAALDLHGRALIVSGVPAPLDLDLALDLADPVTARVTAHATLRELARATVAAVVGLPRRPFDLAAWRATDRRAVQGVDVAIDAIDVDEMMARRLGLPSLRGQVSATIHAEPGLRAVAVHVVGKDVIAGPLVAPVAVAVDAGFDGSTARATLALGLAGATVVTGELSLPLDLRRLIAGTLDPRAVPVTGTLQLADSPIVTITQAVARDRKIGGRIRGHATVGGTLTAPSGVLALVVSDLGVRPPRPGEPPRPSAPPRGGVRELTVDARYQDGALHAALAAQGVDGGTLAIAADLEAARPAAARVSVAAKSFQVGPLARLAPGLLLGVRGVLDADLELRGLDPSAASATGTLRISGAQVPLVDAVGNLRDATVELGLEPGSARLTVAGAVESGHLDVVATARLTALLPDTAQLDVTVRNLKLITTTAPQFDAALHVDLTRAGHHWQAVGRLHDAVVQVPTQEGRELHPTGVPGDLILTTDLRPGRALPRTPASALRTWLGARPTRPWLEATLAIEPVTVVTDRLHGEVKGQLQLALGDDGASVDGRVGVVRGNVILFDRRYGVRRADLAFDGSLDPLLDIQLEYEFPQLSMRVVVAGRLAKPTISLSSTPNTYTEGQLLAILLGGVPGAPGSQDGGFVTGVAAGAASQLIGGFFTRRLPIRIDVLNYEAVTSATSGAFVVGRWITSTLLLLLRTRVEARPTENVNEGEIQLWLNPQILLQGTAGDRGVLGLDLLWNRRW